MSTATATAPVNGAAPPAIDPWQMEVPTGGDGGDYVLCPAGNHPGTIVALFDLGTHEETYQGEAKELRKLALVIELVKKRDDGKPFLLAERYTWSLSEKAKFHALAKNVTGHTFKEGEKFDPRTLVGLPVMANVTHTTVSKDGKEKTYHNLNAVAQFPEGFPLPPRTREPIIWSVLAGQPFPPGGKDLPLIYGESIQSLAESSREHKARLAATPKSADDIPF